MKEAKDPDQLIKVRNSVSYKGLTFPIDRFILLSIYIYCAQGLWEHVETVITLPGNWRNAFDGQGSIL